jgi:hypothetical protein
VSLRRLDAHEAEHPLQGQLDQLLRFPRDVGVRTILEEYLERAPPLASLHEVSGRAPRSSDLDDLARR